ncbi:PorT family protein [Parapusillimonas sp. SGNA-6]|uniref:porin family protein n=1 Tax=Parapedobacter sp. SGR-10 TaxID=2710879 RepID=UPI0013D4A4A3|nr:porin family protein [Parapedobacter sp. SGR-10]NGF54945.1 PorT family protein [Parapedobacter sp. SGR-10]NGM90014.1 PorT family protein [Parapusillimonas sp. SGNA-6]
MKKIVLTLGAAFLLVAGAQAQTGFGLKAGVNFPSYSYGSSDELSDTKSTVGFHVTGYLDAPIAPGLYLQPGVSLQGKGAKFAEVKFGGTTYDVSQNTMWLEVPVNFVGKFPVGLGNVFIGAGPYVGFGLSGKNKVNSRDGSGDGSSNTLNEFSFGKDEELKGTDFGVNFLAGFKLGNGLLLNANYGLGLTNIAGAKSFSDDIKNRGFSVGLGFEF